MINRIVLFRQLLVQLFAVTKVTFAQNLEGTLAFAEVFEVERLKISAIELCRSGTVTNLPCVTNAKREFGSFS